MNIDWLHESFRIGRLSYWTGYADEAECVVSTGNGWQITKDGEGERYSLVCYHQELALGFTLQIESENEQITITLPRASILEKGTNRFGSMLFLPDFARHREGDEGYYILPQQSGVLSRFCGKREAVYRIGVYGSGISECNMPIFGVETPDFLDCAVLKPGNCDATIELATAQGPDKEYRIAFRWFFRHEFNVRRQNFPLVCEDFVLVLKRLGHTSLSPVAQLAEYYRELRLSRGEIEPISERMKRYPALANAVKSPEIRIRLAVKWPFPCEVPHQTPENEPEVHVFCSFEDCKTIIDHFKRAGIQHLNICLVGWAAKGHDGRYPQILPVEESLGGESKLRELIQYCQNAGYFITAHDNHCDAYEISEDPIDEILVHSQEGFPLKDGVWGGGQSYKSCPKAMYETYTPRNYDIIRNLGFRGTHFTDCLSTIGLSVCWNEKHPITKAECAEWRCKILAMAKEKMGSIECEGCFDFALGVLDRCFYIQTDSGRPGHSALLSRDYVDEIVPLYEMTYHGILLYNICRDSINAVPKSWTYLQNLAFGGLPSFYFYSSFSTKHWTPDGRPVAIKGRPRDFSMFDLEQEASDVRHSEVDYVETLGDLQTQFFTDYRKLSEDVTCSHYSDGSRVYVNRGSTDAVLEGVTVPANGFVRVVSG
ncbi:MAG: hypothetical protein IJJ26_10505 [Victivallales bacterium]|nr:hypothetical protein [Victivallales bacterium]